MILKAIKDGKRYLASNLKKQVFDDFFKRNEGTEFEYEVLKYLVQHADYVNSCLHDRHGSHTLTPTNRGEGSIGGPYQLSQLLIDAKGGRLKTFKLKNASADDVYRYLMKIILL